MCLRAGKGNQAMHAIGGRFVKLLTTDVAPSLQPDFAVSLGHDSMSAVQRQARGVGCRRRCTSGQSSILPRHGQRIAAHRFNLAQHAQHAEGTNGAHAASGVWVHIKWTRMHLLCTEHPACSK